MKTSEIAGGDFTWSDLASLSVAMFEPETLHAGIHGLLLCRCGEPDTWVTSGFIHGAWQVQHPDGRKEKWPESEVFDPYDMMKLLSVARGQALPVGAHQNARHEAERVRLALAS